MPITDAPTAFDRDRAVKRLSTVSHVSDLDALWGALLAASPAPDADDWRSTVEALDDDDLAAILDRFDRPGFRVTRRQPPSRFSAERASVGVILPSGRTLSLDVEGPEPAGRYGRGNGGEGQVSWPSIGQVDVRDAAAFGAAIGFASGVAASLAGPDADAD